MLQLLRIVLIFSKKMQCNISPTNIYQVVYKYDKQKWAQY